MLEKLLKMLEKRNIVFSAEINQGEIKEFSGKPCQFQCENFISISADNFFIISMSIYEFIENEIKKGSVPQDFSRIVIHIAQPEEDGKTELGIEFM